MQFWKLLIILLGLILPMSSQAIELTVDEIIYEGGASTDASVLAGRVEMIMTGSGLVITLTNTSTGIASTDSAFNLLTGIGFNLPGGVFISSGSASVGIGSTTIGFSGTDVSGEWGYDSAPLDSGPFQTAPEGIAVSSVTTVISSMQSSTSSKFSATPVASPTGLAGPDFGLLSSAVDAGVAGGLAAIQDTVVIEVSLDGLTDYLLAHPDFDLLAWIESQDLVLSFGSPDSTTRVSEATSLMLLSIGFLGFLVAGKRKRV